MKRKNIFLLYIILLLTFFYSFSFFDSYIYANEITDSNTNLDFKLHCNSGIAMDFESGNILYNNNSTQKIYPASTTKILTCILAIENLNLTDTTIVSKKAIKNTPYDSSIMGVSAGELYTIEELLYGLMLPSGNDAALVLAEAVSNNTEDFVKLMNQKLKDLGCYNTHFTNPHGYHDDNHYTTAYDMATLFKYCLQNETFRKIIGTNEKTVKAANSDKELKLKNSNKMKNKNYTKTFYEYMEGGKTGYTLEARGTFIGYGIKDDKTVIVGSFDGSQNINGLQARFIDTKTLLEYSFKNYSRDLIIKSSDYTFKVYDNKNEKCYTLKPEKDIYGLVNDITNISYKVNLNNEILDELSIENEENTFQKDKIIGSITFNCDFKNNLLDTTNNSSITQNLVLIEMSNYTPKEVYYKKIAKILIFLGILIFIIFISKKKFTKKRKKKIYKYNFYK